MTTSSHPAPELTTPRLGRLTPVMIVESVEPCLRFWAERFGFTIENEVPGPDGRLIFASARRDEIEVMYQTRASVAAQSPQQAGELDGHSITLFITVPDLDAVERALAGVPVVVPRHETFYGTVELYVREPGGNSVGFSQNARGER